MSRRMIDPEDLPVQIDLIPIREQTVDRLPIDKRILPVHHDRTAEMIADLFHTAHMIVMMMRQDHAPHHKSFFFDIRNKPFRLIARIDDITAFAAAAADHIPVAFQTSADESFDLHDNT